MTAREPASRWRGNHSMLLLQVVAGLLLVGLLSITGRVAAQHVGGAASRAEGVASLPTPAHISAAQAPRVCDTLTYYSSDVPRPIPGGGYVTSSLTITGTGGSTIRSIEVVGLNIESYEPGGLYVRLTAPSYNNLRLFREVCWGDRWTSTNTGFNLRDDAAASIGRTCPPRQGTYRPQESLNILQGLPFSGTWTLTIINNTSATGQLNGWGLRITTGDTCSTYTPTATPLPTYTPTSTPTPDCGMAWRSVSSPNPAGESFLLGVDALSASDVWAVGYSNNWSLTTHWNGSSWSVVPSPNLGKRRTHLEDVAAISPDDVWAVGWYETTQRAETVAMHWNGSAWSIVPTPNFGSFGNYLFDVSAASTNDVWAVGYSPTQALTMHWDGAQWSLVPNPTTDTSGTLYGVSARASNDVWAVGYTSDGTVERTRVLHWDGAQWSIVPSPNFGTDFSVLQAVTALSSGEAWAVGHHRAGQGGGYQTLIERWDGAQWSLVPGPDMNGGGYLTGVAAVSSGDVWAVGSYISSAGSSGRTLAIHWDGTAWSISPSPSSGYDLFEDVSAVKAQDVWAVGEHSPTSSATTLTARYSYQCYTPTPVVTPSATPTQCGPSSNYELTQRTGAQIVPGTDLVPGSRCTFCAVPITLPFTYNFYGRAYNSVVASTNGVLNFAGNQTDPFNECMPYYYLGAAIVPHWDSLAMQPNYAPNLGIYTSVTGTAPNRVFNIEWRACRYSDGYCGGIVNFEVRLFERQPTFSIVYGYVTLNGRSATVGVQDANGSRATVYSCNQASLSQGLELVFSQQICGAGTPTPSVTPCPMTFADVFPTDYFYEPVRYLYCGGVISGYSDGTFRPYNNTTRSQLTKIVTLAERWTLYRPSTPTFRDVPTDHPFYAFVETAYSHGVISGYSDGTFRPYNDVTRGQLCKIVVLAEGWGLYLPPGPTFADVPADHPFYAFVETAYSHGVVSGYAGGTFRPGSNATRGQISKIVYLAVTQP